MLRRKITWLIIVVMCFAGTLVWAKDSVVGFKVEERSAASERMEAFSKETAKTAKASVVGQKTLKNNKKPEPAPSPAPAPEVKTEAPPAPKTAGYDKGFFIQSADGKYKIVFSGYAQF